MEEGGGGGGKTYPLLGELTRTFVLAVTEKFDDTLLVGGKSGLRVVN